MTVYAMGFELTSRGSGPNLFGLVTPSQIDSGDFPNFAKITRLAPFPPEVGPGSDAKKGLRLGTLGIPIQKGKS